MNFFQSVFSDDPQPSSRPESEPDPIPDPDPQNPNPTIPSITSAWNFGSTLMKTLASKSESVIETYRRDLEEFSSGIKKETAVILDAVKDLPTSLEAGTGLAQESLESVGQAIDDIGSTVTDIIASSKDSVLSIDHDNNNNYNNNNNNNNNNVMDDVVSNSINKPYSRLDAQIRMVQSDMHTYLKDPEDVEYDEWKLGFRFDEKLGEIDEVMSEKDGVVAEIYREIVPARVDESLFWVRYFYRVYKIKMAEEARVKLVKRAISGDEDEELSWDVDEDEYEENAVSGLKGEVKESVLEDKSLEKKDVDSRTENEKLNEAEVKSDLKTDKDSDITVISTQPSPEVDGWDEIEDIGSSDENKDKDKAKVVARGSHGSADRAELQKQLKRLSVAEEEEDLTWDIEDDED
ncbi:uncharacterized protein LOC143606644 [Bidens hawaiensis]|uniref:uncharacterized protein LOC143606644 n=1 Tax=Bidens hawaiensis TaxID=980011 RepID=UPI00404A0A58